MVRPGNCFPSPGEWGPVLPIMAFVGRFRPKGVPFSCFRYKMKWYEFFVGSLPGSERIFSGFSDFPLSKNQPFQIRRGSRILKWGVNFCNNVLIEPKPG